MNETRIRQLRTTRGMTQEKLAEKSGVAVRTIQRLESGEDASLETLALIASALDVSVQDLFASVDRADLAEAIERLDAIRADQRRQTEEELRRRQKIRRTLIRIVVVAASVVVLLLLALFLSHWITGAATASGAESTFPSVAKVDAARLIPRL